MAVGEPWRDWFFARPEAPPKLTLTGVDLDVRSGSLRVRWACPFCEGPLAGQGASRLGLPEEPVANAGKEGYLADARMPLPQTAVSTGRCEAVALMKIA
jgi:hypothetical protein